MKGTEGKGRGLSLAPCEILCTYQIQGGVDNVQRHSGAVRDFDFSGSVFRIKLCKRVGIPPCVGGA